MPPARQPPRAYRVGGRKRRCRVDRADERVVDLGGREREGRVFHGLERRGGRRGRGVGPERDQLQGGLARRVHAQQPIHLGVDESGQEARREPECTGDGEQVGEHRAGVPEEVPVRARLILPGVSPVDAGEQDGRRPARQRVVGRERRERSAHVTGAHAAKREVAGTEVIEPGLEPGDRAHHHVHLGLEERARRRGGAKEHLAAARVRLLPRHARGIVEHRRELAEAELRRGRRGPGECGERVDRRRIDLARQRNRRKIRVDLERERLDVPLERVAARAHRRG